jgi:hypothetical protein
LTDCKDDEYRCSSELQCIPQSSVCNGIQDCKDGDDEEMWHVKSDPQEHAIFCKIKRSLHNLLDIYEVYYFFHIASSARILQPVNQILYQEPATFISVIL